MTSSSKPFDLTALDPLAAGVFSAATSGERSTRLREWLQTQPAEALLHEVYRELSGRDKGVAKLLKEKLDELKRASGQEALAGEWAQKAEHMLQASRLNIADALAWQRDAAKAGAPLSREPLASLKLRLAEMVKGVEDLQHQVMVQREAAVLVAQRIEVLSTKPMAEAQSGHHGLQADVAQWQNQAQALTLNSVWPSVELKYPSQLEDAGKQLQAVWDGFSAALALASTAQADASAPLPPVPVWADEVRRLRGEFAKDTSRATESSKTEKSDKAEKTEKAEKSDKPAKPKMDPAQRQALRDAANLAMTEALDAADKSLVDNAAQPSPDCLTTLQAALTAHGKSMETALDERVHLALVAAGDAEGWPRWRADLVRNKLVLQAEALLDAEKNPTAGGRKMQDKLRQLRDSWKQADQGNMPNHALWKRFDAACNDAYKTVVVWLEQMKKESADHRAQRVALMDEVKAWTTENAQSDDWRAQLRSLHQFADRWRNAGHLSEKSFGEMQTQWKGTLKAAAMRLEAAQKASIERRQALIGEAQEMAAAPLRVDAVKALQQRWQVEAQTVPLDRKTEQKLWEVFRAPLDEAFQRKGTERHASAAPLTAHDRAVIDASKALDEANAGGDVAQIRAAMAALDGALRGQAQQTQQAPPAPVAAPAADVSSTEPSSAQASESAETAAAQTDAAADAPSGDVSEASDDASASAAPSVELTPAAPVLAPKVAKPVIAVRGDDRPGQKKAESAAGRDGRRDGRPGERGARPGGDRGPARPGERGGDRFGDRAGRGDAREFREERGPRLGDAAFRAQREAMERAEMSLRKLAAQAHGETLTRLMSAWQDRQAEALPSAQEFGRAINAATRQAWAQAVSVAAKAPTATALLRLEMAAEVPTPAHQLSERRMLQLQLLTQRNQPGPSETWGQDVAQVLSGPHEESTARRLQNVLKSLLRS